MDGLNFDSLEAEFVVVGGGPSGTFSSWRLNTYFPEKKVLLVEKENRLGGRLKSFPLGNGEYGELGGQRTFPTIDKELTKTLGILGKKTTPVAYNLPQNVAWLRGQHFLVGVGDEVGQKSERINRVYGIASSGLQSINGAVADAELRLAPMSAGNWQSMFASPSLNGSDYASSLLRQGVGRNTLEAFRDLSGYNFAFDRPISTATGIRENSSLSGSTQQEQIVGGYQSLVYDLASKCTNTTILTGTTFLDFEKVPQGMGNFKYNCFIDTKYGKRKVRTNNIILAIPPDALYRLGLDFSKLVDNWSAFKAYVEIDRKTWNLLSNHGQRNGRNVSDSPMRQLWLYSHLGDRYYLLLYCDNEDATYWRKLVPRDCNGAVEDFMLYPELRKAFRFFCASLFNVNEKMLITWKVRYEYWKHGAFFWRPGAFRDVSTLFPGENIHITGDSFSFSQGWVNGAIEQSDRILTKNYGIPSILSE